MNEHIKEYCENFIESIDNPQFAVFLKDKWGIGKTYFIDNLLCKYKTSNTHNSSDIDESHIIKISLFGVKNYGDIDIKIYEAIHPVLSSNGMKITGAIARSALKKEIIQNLGCTNLRTIWQALYNLHLLIMLIDEEIEDTDKEYIFSIFLVLYIQKNLEEIHKDDQIIDILSGYFKHNIPYKKYKEMKEKGMYLHPGEILHFASIMMLFSKWKLIPDTIDTICEKTEKFLTAFSDEIIPVTGWEYLTEEYAGYGYNANFPEFEKICDNLRELNSKNIEKHTCTDIQEELKLLNTDEGVKN